MCEDALRDSSMSLINLETFSLLPANVVSRREDLKFEFQDQVSQQPLQQEQKILDSFLVAQCQKNNRPRVECITNTNTIDIIMYDRCFDITQNIKYVES